MAAAAAGCPLLAPKRLSRFPERPGLVQNNDRNAFISVADYRRKVLGSKADQMSFKDESAVTLEVSAAQYFPWIILAAHRAIENQTLMPGRFIKVRKMKEQEADGDLPAMAAAMQIIGASYVDTLDTKGTDGSNIHLGGPARSQLLRFGQPAYPLMAG
jgi:hypothetical protein